MDDYKKEFVQQEVEEQPQKFEKCSKVNEFNTLQKCSHLPHHHNHQQLQHLEGREEGESIGCERSYLHGGRLSLDGDSLQFSKHEEQEEHSISNNCGVNSSVNVSNKSDYFADSVSRHILLETKDSHTKTEKKPSNIIIQHHHHHHHHYHHCNEIKGAQIYINNFLQCFMPP